MPLHRPLTSCLFAMALTTVSDSALAAPRGGGQPPPGSAVPSRQLQEDALSDSVRRIERSSRGQVLSAERVPFEGRDVNRIKTLDDHGRVRVFMDDPHPQPPPPPRQADPQSD